MTVTDATEDVSNKEFEASLSLLHMMQRPTETSTKASKKRGSSAGTPSARASKKAKATVPSVESGILLLAVAQQMDPTTMEDDGEDGENDDDEEEGDDDGSSTTSHGFPRRNSQLSMLTHDLSIEELRKHFGKPIVEVAKEFGICTTFLKKICRRLGIKRWPHRQIRSLTRTIEMLHQAEANATSVAEKTKYATQIAHVNAKMSAVINDPDANGKLERVKKSVLNRSGSPSAKKASAAATRSVALPPDLLQTVAAAANEVESTNPVADLSQSMAGNKSPLLTAATEAEATAAAALLSSSASPITKINRIDVDLESVDMGDVLPAMTPKTKPSHSAAADSSDSQSGLRISPINRKLLSVSKGESRVRSSSLGSLQELDDTFLVVDGAKTNESAAEAPTAVAAS